MYSVFPSIWCWCFLCSSLDTFSSVQLLKKCLNSPKKAIKQILLKAHYFTFHYVFLREQRKLVTQFTAGANFLFEVFLSSKVVSSTCLIVCYQITIWFSVYYVKSIWKWLSTPCIWHSFQTTNRDLGP